MNPDLFLADLHSKPEVMRRQAALLRQEDPWDFLVDAPRQISFVGMGSSAYAAHVAAARLRACGFTAVSDLASSELLPAWHGDTLVVAISASGRSKETLDALSRSSPGLVVGLTNNADSPLSEIAGATVHLDADVESGGVACRSFTATIVQLLALEQHLRGLPLSGLADDVERAADATEHVISTTTEWLPLMIDLLDGPDGTHLVAPARRLSSAHQGALMLREGPRRFAVGCEAGDWAHVDLYLTKNTDYRLLVFAGSRWDDGIAEWTQQRGTTVAAVGGDFPDAKAVLRFPGDDVDDVRLLTETIVPELVAAHLWSRSAV